MGRRWRWIEESDRVLMGRGGSGRGSGGGEGGGVRPGQDLIGALTLHGFNW